MYIKLLKKKNENIKKKIISQWRYFCQNYSEAWQERIK